MSARFTDALRRRLVEQAIDFLAAEYELDAAQQRALHAVPVRWRRRHGRSAFYMKPKHGFVLSLLKALAMRQNLPRSIKNMLSILKKIHL